MFIGKTVGGCRNLTRFLLQKEKASINNPGVLLYLIRLSVS